MAGAPRLSMICAQHMHDQLRTLCTVPRLAGLQVRAPPQSAHGQGPHREGEVLGVEEDLRARAAHAQRDNRARARSRACLHEPAELREGSGRARAGIQARLSTMLTPSSASGPCCAAKPPSVQITNADAPMSAYRSDHSCARRRHVVIV